MFPALVLRTAEEAERFEAREIRLPRVHDLPDVERVHFAFPVLHPEAKRTESAVSSADRDHLHRNIAVVRPNRPPFRIIEHLF